MAKEAVLKPVHFIASSLEDLRTFPDEARAEAGYAIYLAQLGDKAFTAVPMVGFGGAKVLEVVIDEDGDAFRAVYTVKFKKAVYVLHAFQKKSKRGDGTPRTDMRLIRHRIAIAERHYSETYERIEKERQTHERRGS